MVQGRRIILSGCSGGGKSTLLAALGARGHLTVREPGRRIVQRALATGGTELPWIDAAAFARACILLAIEDLAGLPQDAPLIFFDRSLHDNAFALRRLGHPVPPQAQIRPYSEAILFPPWPALRQTDDERRGSMRDAEAEYDDLLAQYPVLYPTHLIPRVSIADRVAWLDAHLSLAQ